MSRPGRCQHGDGTPDRCVREGRHDGDHVTPAALAAVVDRLLGVHFNKVAFLLDIGDDLPGWMGPLSVRRRAMFDLCNERDTLGKLEGAVRATCGANIFRPTAATVGPVSQPGDNHPCTNLTVLNQRCGAVDVIRGTDGRPLDPFGTPLAPPSEHARCNGCYKVRSWVEPVAPPVPPLDALLVRLLLAHVAMVDAQSELESAGITLSPALEARLAPDLLAVVLETLGVPEGARGQWYEVLDDLLDDGKGADTFLAQVRAEMAVGR